MSIPKRQKHDKFESYKCECIHKVTIHNIPLKFQSIDNIQCVLKNYKKFLISRNMWPKFTNTYRNMIDRNINYPDETIIGVKLMKSTNYEDNTLIEDSKIRIYATAYQAGNVSEFVIACDLMCFEEYLIFLNKHIFNDDLETEMANAKSAYDVIKTCNF